MQPYLELTELKRDQVLVEAGEAIEFVYFVEDCVAAVLSCFGDGSTVQTITVGHEGLVGLPVFLGSDAGALRAVTQVPGTAYRMRTADFRAAIDENPTLQHTLRKFAHTQIIFLAQTSACVRLHPMEQHLVQWLLSTHDRVSGDSFTLTHQTIATLVGVRRATVTVVMSKLQKANLIRYSRGAITILDRAGLEAACCECYNVIKTEFTRTLGKEFKKPA